MTALVDCNSFYASCEKVFRPDLRNRPVVVLSNNDGCIVARSPEVKKLGIAPFADPYFKVKDALAEEKTAVFSSNYTLYGDISSRIMTMLSDFSPKVEVYSIDEMFLDLSNIPFDLYQYGVKIRETVTQGVGVPVSIGIAANKTLAKVANRIAKKNKNGVCLLTENIPQALQQVQVSDIWGVGFRYASFLRRNNVHTALDLISQNDTWVRKNMSVVGLRMVKELRGEACIDFEEVKKKQQIVVSRSFNRKVESLKELEEAVTSYTAKAAAKLRSQNSCTGSIHIFIATAIHNEPQRYKNGISYRFDPATSDTVRLVRAAKNLVAAVYHPCFRYIRAGVILSRIVPENEIQMSLFGEKTDSDKKRKLMRLVDSLQKHHNIGWGAENRNKSWQMKREFLSPRYTTCWDELPVVKIG